MADIFLSYNEKDRPQARRLVARLQAAGWSVWWDRRIPAGQTWRSVLAHELETMRCMVVLWSRQSVASEWVCEEANEGRQLGRLVPVSIEAVRPPAGFREIQAADLVGWDGSSEHVGLQQLLQDIERLIGKPEAADGDAKRADGAAPAPAAPPSPHTSDAAASAASNTPTPSTRRLGPWLLAGLGLLALAGGFVLKGGDRNNAGAPPAGSLQATAAQAARDNPPAAAVAVPRAAREAPPIPPKSDPVAATPLPKPTHTAPHNPKPLRCTALLERAALGEALTPEAKAFLQKECRP